MWYMIQSWTLEETSISVPFWPPGRMRITTNAICCRINAFFSKNIAKAFKCTKPCLLRRQCWNTSRNIKKVCISISIPNGILSLEFCPYVIGMLLCRKRRWFTMWQNKASYIPKITEIGQNWRKIKRSINFPTQGNQIYFKHVMYKNIKYVKVADTDSKVRCFERWSFVRDLYRQYTDLFLFRYVSEHSLRRTLRLY